MTQQFNYLYHELAVAIFNWAESQIARAHLPREYFDIELKKALDICRDKNLQWYPHTEEYHGKAQNMRGKVAVSVVMPDGYSYGFSFGKVWATQIDEILHKLWIGGKQ